jgi:hypothetical protein
MTKIETISRTRLLLFFSPLYSSRRASYASNRDKFAHKALRLVVYSEPLSFVDVVIDRYPLFMTLFSYL